MRIVHYVHRDRRPFDHIVSQFHGTRTHLFSLYAYVSAFDLFSFTHSQCQIKSNRFIDRFVNSIHFYTSVNRMSDDRDAACDYTWMRFTRRFQKSAALPEKISSGNRQTWIDTSRLDQMGVTNMARVRCYHHRMAFVLETNPSTSRSDCVLICLSFRVSCLKFEQFESLNRYFVFSVDLIIS